MDIMVMHGALSAGSKLYRKGDIITVDDTKGEDLMKQHPDQFCQAVGNTDKSDVNVPDKSAPKVPEKSAEAELPSADPSAVVTK
ncbi:hypothetical protein [Megasphaera elsdenii]|uniref:hypothetical protein n=1 Tax=Megasphaera elsdenii TaxID=907 RepID=UPI0024328E60|nr:hypothetical protein [Megasphaera elsdenii]